MLYVELVMLILGDATMTWKVELIYNFMAYFISMCEDF